MKQPYLQIALDHTDLQSALQTLEQTHSVVDIIEVGTLLCLAEGMHAVREIRKHYPEHTIVADVRIVRAGAKIAQMAFDAGADSVTVVAEAPEATIEAVVQVARDQEKDLQIELRDSWTAEQIGYWQSQGIKQLIYHSKSEVIPLGDQRWSTEAYKAVRELAEAGFDVTVTGGITVDLIASFTGIPVHIFIAGRSIYTAPDPLHVAQKMREVMALTYA